MSHLGDRITALVDGRLSPAEQDKVLAHVRHCAICRDELAYEQWVAERLQLLPGAEPSAALLMALKDLDVDDEGHAGGATILPDNPAIPSGWPLRRRSAVLTAGAGTIAAGVLGLAYVVGGTQPADPVRPPVDQFSAEFAGSTDPLPFADPATELFPVVTPSESMVDRR
jgi:anti-sigma factor RsiW